MNTQNENTASQHALLSAGACVAAGFFVLILMSAGAFEGISPPAYQVQVALFFLITAVGAILAYLLGLIADQLKASS